MSEACYDLKESRRSVRELYPVLEDVHGNVIDGFTRLKEIPEWRRERREHIRTRAQLWLARIIANTHRRVVSQEERSNQLTELARALVEDEKVPKERVVPVLSDLTTFSDRYVRELLPDEFKRSYTPPDKSELSSEYEDLANGSGPARTESPSETSIDTKAQNSFPEAPAHRGSVEDSISLFRPEDLMPEEEGGVRGFIVDRLSKWHGLTPEQAEESISNYIKKARAQPPQRATRHPSGRYEAEALVTCTCPLCGRVGADRNRILMQTENPEVAQLTLLKFVAEALR